MKYLDTKFIESDLKRHLAGTSKKEYLMAHLSGSESAIEFHKRNGNSGQVEFFTEAAAFIKKKLKIKVK